MSKKFSFRAIVPFALLMLFALVVAIRPAEAQIVKNARAGQYLLTLKVAVAESFNGHHPEMIHDSGAPPVQVDGAEHPNHHLVIFVDKGGKPVLDAQVHIRYRVSGDGHAAWTDLPMARMHHSGTGLETTHYGNNVFLAPGHYDVEVKVNDEAPVIIPLSLRQ